MAREILYFLYCDFEVLVICRETGTKIDFLQKMKLVNKNGKRFWCFYLYFLSLSPLQPLQSYPQANKVLPFPFSLLITFSWCLELPQFLLALPNKILLYLQKYSVRYDFQNVGYIKFNKFQFQLIIFDSSDFDIFLNAILISLCLLYFDSIACFISCVNYFVSLLT